MSARTFEYTVVSAKGKLVTGRIEAPDESAVANRLRDLGLTATAIEQVATTGLNREITLGGGRAKAKDVALLVRQLATMVAAGLSLGRAVHALRVQAAGGPLDEILGDVERRLSTGDSLSHALAEHPRVFSPVVVAMVESGEVGGYLDEVLEAVATTLEKEIELRGQVKGAMVYPVVVLVFAVIAVTAMLLFIVPVFQGIFADVGAELPLPTQLLVWAADGLRIGIVPLVAALVAGSVWWKKHRHDAAVRERLDPLKLRVPIFGPLATKIAITRFAQNLATMTRVGVPVVPALHTVGPTTGNLVIERAVERICAAVERGVPLGDALAEEEVFPVMLRQMVSVGEESGALDTMLARVATFYDREVATTTGSLTSVLEPLLIVGIGVVVGAMLIALYLPIFMLSDAVG